MILFESQMIILLMIIIAARYSRLCNYNIFTLTLCHNNCHFDYLLLLHFHETKLILYLLSDGSQIITIRFLTRWEVNWTTPYRCTERQIVFAAKQIVLDYADIIQMGRCWVKRWWCVVQTQVSLCKLRRSQCRWF